MSFINDFQAAWASPPMRHAILVHWPVVLSVLSAAFALALALNKANNLLLHWISLLICAGVMVSGYVALQSGGRAENALPPVDERVEKAIEAHEELAEKVPYFGAICTALVIISFIPRSAVRITATWLAVAMCGATAAWVANTAHHGGLLVYEHGAGMPQRASIPTATLSSDPQIAFFQQHVKPILVDTCAKCHNPAKVARGKSGRLDQTTREGLLKGGRSGPALVPGKPEDSLLLKRLRGEVPDEDPMPPPPKPPITTEQIAALEQWIRDGAVWDR